MAAWLVCLTLDQAVQVPALAGNILLCSWAKNFTLTVPLYTQVCCKFNTGGTCSPAMDQYPLGGVEIFLVATETGISSGLMGHLACIQIRLNRGLHVLTNCDCKSLVPCKIFNAWSHSKPRSKQQDSLCYGHRYIWSQCSCFSFLLPGKKWHKQKQNDKKNDFSVKEQLAIPIENSIFLEFNLRSW